MADDQQLCGHTDLFADEDLMQIVNASDRLLIESNDQIAFVNARAFGRAALFHRNNEHPGFAWKIVEAHDAAMQRHVLAGDADVAAPNFPIADEPCGHEFCGIARNRETNTLSR